MLHRSATTAEVVRSTHLATLVLQVQPGDLCQQVRPLPLELDARLAQDLPGFTVRRRVAPGLVNVGQLLGDDGHRPTSSSNRTSHLTANSATVESAALLTSTDAPT